jgi:transposase InsO family protein
MKLLRCVFNLDILLTSDRTLSNVQCYPEQKPSGDHTPINGCICFRARGSFSPTTQGIPFMIDEYSREGPAVRAARKLKAADVIETIYRLFVSRGVPAHISSDRDPEFVAVALRERMAAVGTKTAHIESRSSCENGYCESFQRQTARGTAQRIDILYHEGGTDRHQKVAPPLQRGVSTLITGMPPAGARGAPLATVKTRGANAISRLTFPIEHSIRANLSWCSHAR